MAWAIACLILGLENGSMAWLNPRNADVHRPPLEDLGAPGLEGGGVGRVDRLELVDLARLQRLAAGGAVGDGPEDDPPELGLVAPVVVVADEDEPVAPGPALEAERPGADRVLGAEGPLELRRRAGVTLSAS